MNIFKLSNLLLFTVIATFGYLDCSTKEKSKYIVVEYEHCYPVMKFKNDYDIMYWETKCVKRTYKETD
ncbi:MAG: hypothetical protein ACXACW_11305 [Candidatus Hodarchaeales archaeon]|jgi:hypothetical protein